MTETGEGQLDVGPEVEDENPDVADLPDDVPDGDASLDDNDSDDPAGNPPTDAVTEP